MGNKKNDVQIKKYDEDGLTHSQKKFCDLHLSGITLTDAYLAVHPNCKRSSAPPLATNFKKNINILAYLKKVRKESSKKLVAKYNINRENVLAAYANIAFFDVRELYDDKGFPLPPNKLSTAASQAIQKSYVKAYNTGDDGVTPYLSDIAYVVSDRMAALNSLAKHLDLFNDNTKTSESSLVDLIEEIRKSNDEEIKQNLLTN